MATGRKRTLKRLFRLRSKQVAAIGQKADDQLEKNFLSKLSNLLGVRRFVAGWLVLVLLLAGCVIAQINALGGYYQTVQPVEGGIYSEGIVGSYTNANPLYATGPVDEAVSKLLFAGLFSYDDKNRLAPNLAASYTVNDAGTEYTVKLRKNLKWHDGEPLTSKDVLFTYKTIQNPDAQSPLNRSWQGVGITAKDERTVVFKLPNPLSSFPYSLTTGLVPEHVLKPISLDTLRSAKFNTIKPVGAGPFKFRTLEVTGDTPTTRQVEVALEPFDGYFDGKPKLSSFVVHTFPNQDSMLNSFRDKSITAMVGLRQMPGDLREDKTVKANGLPLTAATMAFFKTTNPVLANKEVRQALVQGAEPNSIIDGLGYQAQPVKQPVLRNQIGYDQANGQVTGQPKQAAAALEAAGWVPGRDGIRSKAGQRLAFKLYAEDNPEYQHVARTLEKQWRAIGADVQIYLQGDDDLRYTVAYHTYDALLYGISIGTDPDVFAYWHSTQGDVRSQNRLNFSEYRSAVADEALEAGRTRTDEKLRAVKYQAFLKAWKDDAPALGLYQPRFLYVTRGEVHNLVDHTVNSGTDRFDTVHEWMIRQAPRPTVPR